MLNTLWLWICEHILDRGYQRELNEMIESDD